jgi:ribonuclease Y
MEYIISAIVGLVVGGALGAFLGRKSDPEEVARVKREAEEEVARARKEAEIEAREKAVAMSADAEAEHNKARQELLRREEKLRSRDEGLEKRQSQLSKKESQVNRREKELVRREKRVSRQEDDVTKTIGEARRQLERIAGMSQTEARRSLVDEVRDEARKRSIEEVRSVEAEARRVAEERARMIISSAIQRYASEHVTERTVSVLPLPNEDMKGRIIGREGRNIRAFESATGCDLIVDETPEAVVISCFNPVRREVARMALGKLLSDGRIHPTRIEEVVNKTRDEMEGIVRKRGEEAALELEVAGLHPELVKLLGRLHYRTSFAQNVLRHSIEVGFLAGAMAAELGLDEKKARRAGLLHDIGKAVDHEMEGPHAVVGAQICRKHGEAKAIVAAIASHHEHEPPNSVLGQLIAAANTLSGSRPGARRDTLASYIKRLEDLEALTAEFEGVESCYAIQAGQELRVMVENARISDSDAELLTRDIARKVEQELTYPGSIKVTVIRETRAVQYAR